MTVNLSAFAGAGQQFFDNNGVPLSAGKLYSYAAGTTTPQTTYTDAAGNVAHANPIILDSAGRVSGGEIWLSAGINYKFVLNTSTNVLIQTLDNITGINGTGISVNASNVSFTGVKNQSGNVQNLGDNNGSDWIGFTPNGTNSTTVSVQDQLFKSQTTDARLEIEFTVPTATSQPRNISAVNGFLHVINQASATQSTYQIFDIATENTPILISTTNVGAIGDDYRALVVVNDRVYLGSLTTGEIKTYSILDKSNPSLLSTVTIPSGGIHSLNVFGGVLFATGYQAGIIVAYDITSDTPVFLSDLALGVVSVMGSYISGDYLYCCSNSTSVRFFSVNIKNPVNLSATSVTLPITAQNGRNVCVNGKYAYVVCIASNSVEILDVSNPNSPTFLSSIAVPGPTGNCQWVRSLGKYLIVGAGATAIYDATNPSAPIFIQNISAVGTAFDFYGNRIFIADYPNNNIVVVRSPFPSTVMQMGGAMVLDSLNVKEQYAEHITSEAIDVKQMGAVDVYMSKYSASKQSGARVYATANQTISAGVATIVQFANTLYDNQTEWSAMSNAFTAKADGIYLVATSLLTDSTYAIGNSGQVDLLLNGTVNAMIGYVVPLTVATNRQVNGTCLVKMNKGQNIQIRWFSINATTLLASSANTWMAVQKVA